MNISIVTTAYNGYGVFADQWLESISNSKTLPAKVIIALGKDHGLENHNELLDKYSMLDLQFHFCENVKPLMGPMRNAAVNQTETEWVQYLSIDDILLPDAIDEYMKVEAEADYICIMWQSKAMWRRSKILTHIPKTPEEMATLYRGKGFIVGHSPFRRSFWEKYPYKPHDYPNAPFVADLVEAGARFVKTEQPCTMYLRRLESHAARLGRRGHGAKIATIDLNEKQQANRWKNNMQKRIVKYYREKNQ